MNTRNSSIMAPAVRERISRSGGGQSPFLQNIARFDRYATAIVPEVFMTNQLRQEPLARSSSRDFETTRSSVRSSGARWQQQTWCQEQEREWQSRLSDMQRCICDLLYENQRLREIVISATNYPSKELADE